MHKKSQILTQSCFQVIVLATTLLHGNAVLASANDTLVVTAQEILKLVYVDGTNRSLSFGQIWNISDSVQLEPHTRLIAFEAFSLEPSCSGVLASSIGNSILTDARFKCHDTKITNWEKLGYDDSNWPNAVEYGDNTNGHSTCSQKHIFTNIDPNAKWIWTTDTVNHFVAYCRGYTSLCELSSPCLNNGTCLKNDQVMCSCPPQFTGQFCEKEISTGTPEDMTEKITTLTESKSPDTSATTPTSPSVAVSGSSADASRTTSIITTQIKITSDGSIDNTTESTTVSGGLTTGSFGECSEQFYCNGPLEVPGSSIEHCQCPSGYLNTNDNCCLNQWWIIGLTLISTAVVVAIIVAISACLGCPCKSKKGKHTLKTEEDIHRNTSPQKVVHGLPETGVGVTKGLEEVTVHSDGPATVANGKAIHPATVTAAAVSMTTSAESTPKQPQHPLPDYDGEADLGTSIDLLYNPLMVELLNSDVGRTFQPSIVTIPSDIQYVIKRSSVTDEED